MQPESAYYSTLQGRVNENILHLQDARGKFLLDKVNEMNIQYFINNVIDMPWCNHFLLAVFIQTDRNLDPRTIGKLFRIQPRMKELFQIYSIPTMSEFNVDIHMYGYLTGECYPEHSNNMRWEFLAWYKTFAYNTKKWLTQKLNQEEQAYFEQFLLQMPSFDSRGFSFKKLAMEQRQNNRKDETDAIVPYLPEIRATARFRWNQMKRLRDAFYKAIEDVQKLSDQLPLEFYYDEPERIGERLYFRLWDKSSFVLHHQEQFTESVVEMAINRKVTYSDENNHFFVEFVKAERIDNDEEADGLWFTEIIQLGVLGKWSQNATEEEIQRKRTLLNLWGYGEEKSKRNPEPFDGRQKGILFQSTFVSLHKDKAEGVLFDVEPFYVACTFGLLAVDVFTTTGARMNELLQINSTKECIQVKKVKDKLHYSFRVTPKGRDEVEEFYISRQTMEYIQIVLRMLKDHFQSDKIPSVEYRYERKHLFPEPKPYYFQYEKKALIAISISSCIRFLLHALRFETQEGNPVAVKSHLLRHAFATEAVQRQKMPIDIVAKILHQRNLNVTGYYSAPTATQVAQAVGELHDVIASYVDIDEAILRSPEELQKELEEHNSKVGVFNKVLGGTCVTDYVCPTKMACLGCKAKIPEPEQEHELHELIELSKYMEERYTEMGLDVEVKKAKEMRKQARIELKEIELIKQYREEQQCEPIIHTNKR
ncbi:site-specific integrase [Brevibacillus sp. AY1]|uniref:site-specific integrase n=1 Tax=Brevibacillus sp. AY1 TaxID=2807621 RepID=UPI002458A25C|nr:site-specific integrase [Brevibacillus sp. AY1]MDH4616591.1 site-specific integrase [Brevibacillus sp. AY1]